MGKESRSERIHWLILVLLIIFHVTGNYVVLRLDNVFLTGDSAPITMWAAGTLQDLQQSQSTRDKVKMLYTNTPPEFPPLVQTTATMFMMIFGTKQDVAVMANSLFLVLLIVSTYLLGRRLFNKDTSLIATIILSFFPATYSFSRTLLVDFGLMAVVAFSILMLWRTDQLSSFKWSCFWGVSMGFAALTKPPFSLFLLGPFLAWVVVPFARSIRQKDWGRVAKMIRNGLLAILIGTVIAFPWYYKYTHTYLTIQRDDLPYSVFGVSIWQTLSKLHPVSPFLLAKTYMTTIGALVFFLCLMYFSWKGRERFAVLSWLVIPYILMHLLSGPNPLQYGIEIDFMRYLLPSLPAAAYVVSFGLMRLIDWVKGRIPLVRRIHFVLAVLLLVEIAGYAAIHLWGNGYLIEPFGPELQGYDKYRGTEYLGITAPQMLPFDIEASAKLLADHISHKTPPVRIFSLRLQGGITKGLLAAIELSRDFPAYNEFSCAELWFSSSPVYGIARSSPARHNCSIMFDQADIILLESLYNVEGSWLWKNPEVYINEAVPLVEYIQANLHHYELVTVLSLGIPGSEDWRDLHPSFRWLNESLWIYVKK